MRIPYLQEFNRRFGWVNKSTGHSMEPIEGMRGGAQAGASEAG